MSWRHTSARPMLASGTPATALLPLFTLIRVSLLPEQSPGIAGGRPIRSPTTPHLRSHTVCAWLR
ncbi:hypothetical protein PUN4_510015 [Paraburkholderia unamae]|nr:hypothetical protein PUN4_510015 [Paraburkholderia unamae]